MHEHQYPDAGVAAADAEVVQAAVMPQGGVAVGVDAGAAHPVVLGDLDAAAPRSGLGACGVGGRRGPAADAAVGTLLVVVGGEGVQLGLQLGDAAGAGLPNKPLLQRLV